SRAWIAPARAGARAFCRSRRTCGPSRSPPAIRRAATTQQSRDRGRRSATFEVPGELPVGDGLVVEDRLLLHGGVQQVFEREVAEGLARDLTLAERLDRLVERMRHTMDVLRLVVVAVEHRRGLDRVLDPPQAGGDRGGEREVRVR